MEKNLFGKMPDGTEVYSFRLDNGKIFAEIITYGAIMRGFGISDGNSLNVIGSYDTIEDYLSDGTYQGALVGRFANRIENAAFTLDGVEYKLTKNDGENCHHGGRDGFNSKVWTVKSTADDYIELSYFSPDGESGFPGNLKATVRYTLVDSSLVITYTAVSDKKTPISLTSHPYFNLDGVGGYVYNHDVAIFADEYSAVNENLVATGEHVNVSGSLLDLRKPRNLGEVIKEGFYGYDHNFILSPAEYRSFLGRELAFAATATNGRLMLKTYTTLPGIQLYTGNALCEAPDFRGGIKKINHGAFCLEAQFEPNSPNRGEAIFEAGEIYSHATAYELKKI